MEISFSYKILEPFMWNQGDITKLQKLFYTYALFANITNITHIEPTHGSPFTNMD